MFGIEWSTLITATLTALFISAFVAVENWVIQKHLIKNLETLTSKLKNGKGQK